MRIGEGTVAGTGGEQRGSGKSTLRSPARAAGEKSGDEGLAWASGLHGWWSKMVLYRGSSTRAIMNGRLDASPRVTRELNLRPTSVYRGMGSEGRAVRSTTHIVEGGNEANMTVTYGASPIDGGDGSPEGC